MEDLQIRTFSCVIVLYYLFFVSINSIVPMVEAKHLIRHSSNRNHTNSSHSSSAEEQIHIVDTEAELARELSVRTLELRNHWNCSEPKPRLVYISEENPTRITPHTRWIPEVVVLHRCEHFTGCCLNHPAETCQPIDSHPVQILFKQFDYVTERETYERLTFTNHTVCGCQTEGSTTVSFTTSSTTPLPPSTISPTASEASPTVSSTTATVNVAEQ